jgi:hypothetical protein
MVCYVFDCDYVKVAPMKSRSSLKWVKSYDHIHQELTAKGFKPKLQTLDNEASNALKNLQGSPLLIQPFHYICGKDFCPKRKLL